MKIVFYSDGKDLRKIIYTSSLLKNLKKDVYIFINNFNDLEKLKKIKEKEKINFIVSKKKISKIKAIKIIRERLNDDLLFLEGSLNFNIKKIKDISSDKNIIKFGYKSKFLKIFNLNQITRVFFCRKEITLKDLIRDLEEKTPDVNLDYYVEKQFLLDILNNIKRLVKNYIKLIIGLTKKKIIKDLIDEKIGYLFLKFFTFLLMIVLSRFLAIEIYGRYINFHSLVSSIAAFISLSLPLYKFFSEKKSERPIYLINAVFLYLLNTTIILIFLLIFRDFFFKVFDTKNLLIIPILVITSFFLVIRGLIANLFISDLKFNINKYFDIFEGTLKFIIVISLSILFPTKGVILGIFFTFIILNFIEIIYLRKYYSELIKEIKLKFNFKKIVELLKHGISLNYSNILLSFYSSFRYSLVSYIKGAIELSMYYNALNVVYIISALFSIYSVIFPRLVTWSKEKIKERIKYFFITQLVIYILSTIILITFSSKIIGLLFGEKYLEAALYLKYCAILLPIFSMSIFYNLLWLKSYLKEISIINLIYLISMFLLDFLLIPRIGIFGAIFSNIFSTSAYFLAAFIFFKIKI